MDCKKKKKTNNKCNHKSAKYLEPPKGILVSFCPLCSESCVGTLGESFLLFIGVLLRLASCLFCMVFAKKCLLREESFTFFFCSFKLFVCNFGPQEVPTPPSSFFS